MNGVGAVSDDLDFDVAGADYGFFDEDGAAGYFPDAAGVGFGDFGGGFDDSDSATLKEKGNDGLERGQV